MIELLTPEELKDRKFFHKPMGSNGVVLPHASYVKEFVDSNDMIKHIKQPVRLAHTTA